MVLRGAGELEAAGVMWVGRWRLWGAAGDGGDGGKVLRNGSSFG
jgi:hypothetical protein